MVSDQVEEGPIYYLRVIWKWKGVILGGTLFIAAVALVVHFLTTKTYEVSRTLKIGMLMGKPLESREATIDRIKDERLLRQVIGVLNLDMTPTRLAKQITIDPKSNPNIRYTVQASSPELTLKIAEAISDRIVEAHQQIFTENFSGARRESAELTEQVRIIEAEISRLRGALAGLSKTSEVDSTLTILLTHYTLAVTNLYSLKKSLRDELLKLSPPQSENTTVIASDVQPVNPVSPKMSTTAQIVGLGLFLLILLVFFLERLERPRGSSP